MGVNIGEVVNAINQKTSAFKGMQVPVTVTIDDETKEFTIEVGTPPASSLILKEAHIAKGAANPLADKIADLRIENIIKIAKMKEDNLLGATLKEKVKEIIGTCNSMGIMVEGVAGVDAIKDVNSGKFDKQIKEEKTEISASEQAEMDVERKKLEEEMAERREEFEATAKDIIAKMQGKERGAIKTRLIEEGIPTPIIEELLPVEVAAPADGAPAEGAAEGEAPAEEKKEE